jgi:hypothetical protein
MYFAYKRLFSPENTKVTLSYVIVLGTTISPWIVTLDALEPFACDAPEQVANHHNDL